MLENQPRLNFGISATSVGDRGAAAIVGQVGRDIDVVALPW